MFYSCFHFSHQYSWQCNHMQQICIAEHLQRFHDAGFACIKYSYHTVSQKNWVKRSGIRRVCIAVTSYIYVVPFLASVHLSCFISACYWMIWRVKVNYWEKLISASGLLTGMCMYQVFEHVLSLWLHTYGFEAVTWLAKSKALWQISNLHSHDSQCPRLDFAVRFCDVLRGTSYTFFCILPRAWH